MKSLDSLLSTPEMLAAWRRRDRSFDGLFVLAVRTTGIFCRPSCPSQPLEQNLEFLESPAAAFAAGYRPCKRCHPTLTTGQRPEWVQKVMDLVQQNPGTRVKASDLCHLGLTAETVRRWFSANLGVTFARWQREQRLSRALQQLNSGASIDDAVCDSSFESHSGFRSAFTQVFDRSPGQAQTEDSLCATWFETPLGPMVGLADSQGLRVLEFADPARLEPLADYSRRTFGKPLLHRSNACLDKLNEELGRYFQGQLSHFETRVAPVGSPFQMRVWQALQRIPFGTTASYADIASQLGNVQAVRAVARANATNPIYLLIPCHRVIAKDGTLSGYGGGVWRKRALIELEKRGSWTLVEKEGCSKSQCAVL